MVLTDTKVRSAKPEEKEYSLVDGDGMLLLAKPNGSKYWRSRSAQAYEREHGKQCVTGNGL